MLIGVPKEIKEQEHRIGLTPESVKVLTSNGNEVLRYPRTHPATLPLSETEVWVAPGELGPPIFKIKGVCQIYY